MSFPAVLDLTTLGGTAGFIVRGLGPSGTNAVVARAGDFDGNGYADFIIGDLTPKAGGGWTAGWVILGREANRTGVIDASSLNNVGFRLTAPSGGPAAGFDVGTVGDFDGDGRSDLIVAGERTDGSGPDIGIVLYGSHFVSPEYNIGQLGNYSAFGIIGGSSSPAPTVTGGDLNGDGRADAILGTVINGLPTAAVRFGTAQGWGFSVTADALNGSNGFQITMAGTMMAAEVVGDINGDGYDDVLLSTGAGSAGVVFGKAGGFAAQSAAVFDGTAGFALDTHGQTLLGIAAAGDVNGDGREDFIVGAPDAGSAGEGAAYVVFGRTGAYAATLDLAALNGVNGFRLTGVAAGDGSGASVASAGDVNDDGYDDLLIGGHGGDNYLVFGKASGFAATLSLGALDGTNGIILRGPPGVAGGVTSVSGIGDINGDGADDFAIAAPQASAADPNLIYVVYGLPRANNFTGGAADDAFSGGTGIDTITGGAGRDVLRGLRGDDLISGDDNGDALYGGEGNDQLSGGSGGDGLYGDAGDDLLQGGADGDKLFGGDGADRLEGGDGNDILAGGDGIDTLIGGDGNDLLQGGLSVDFLIGGRGNDVYVLDGPSDLFEDPVEQADEGYDVVRTNGVAFTLPDNIEGLEMLAGARNATGNDGANNLQGNGSNNSLQGRGGVDTINGADGDDIITGGTGNDLLRGGLGADTFSVLQESIKRPVLETDQIYDFSAAEGDRLNLSLIDANSQMSGSQAFRLVEAFSKHDTAHPELTGQMTLTFAGGITTLRLDVDGDGKADYQMKINGDVTAESGGWLL